MPITAHVGCRLSVLYALRVANLGYSGAQAGARPITRSLQLHRHVAQVALCTTSLRD